MGQFLSTDFGGNLLGVTRLKLAFENLIFFGTRNGLSDDGFGASVTCPYGLLSFFTILLKVLFNPLSYNTRERNHAACLTPATAPYRKLFLQEDTHRKYMNNVKGFTICSEMFRKKHY